MSSSSSRKRSGSKNRNRNRSRNNRKQQKISPARAPTPQQKMPHTADVLAKKLAEEKKKADEAHEIWLKMRADPEIVPAKTSLGTGGSFTHMHVPFLTADVPKHDSNGKTLFGEILDYEKLLQVAPTRRRICDVGCGRFHLGVLAAMHDKKLEQVVGIEMEPHRYGLACAGLERIATKYKLELRKTEDKKAERKECSLTLPWGCELCVFFADSFTMLEKTPLNQRGAINTFDLIVADVSLDPKSMDQVENVMKDMKEGAHFVAFTPPWYLRNRKRYQFHGVPGAAPTETADCSDTSDDYLTCWPEFHKAVPIGLATTWSRSGGGHTFYDMVRNNRPRTATSTSTTTAAASSSPTPMSTSSPSSSSTSPDTSPPASPPPRRSLCRNCGSVH